MHIMRTHVGIFGGTFDPVHEGHCAVARAVQIACSFSRMIWMPAGHPWQKSAINAPINHRLSMLSKAVLQLPGHEISLHEAYNDGITYTIETVRALRGDLGYDFPLTLVLGWDSFSGIGTWKNGIDILNEVNLAIVPRYGLGKCLLDPVLSLWRKRQRCLFYGQYYGAVLDVPMVSFDVSSSFVKDKIREIGSCPGLPPGVAAYVSAYSIYK